MKELLVSSFFKDLLHPSRSKSKAKKFDNAHSGNNVCTPRGSIIPTQFSAENFEIFENQIVATGGTSMILLGVNKIINQQVAIKCINYSVFSPLQIERMWREIDIMSDITNSEFHHKFIQLYAISHNSEEKKLYLFMEYIKGMNLLEYFNFERDKLCNSNAEDKLCNLQCDRVRWENIVKLKFHDIVNSVCILHSMNICHTDLKFENILVDENNEVRIIDFGFSNYTKQQSLLKPTFQTEYVGTINYAPPEILNNLPYDGKKADVWSLGIIVFYLLVGKFPFSEDQTITSLLVSSVIQNSLDADESISLAAKSLIKSLLQYSPDSRISLDNALLHPWFSQ